MSLNPSTFVPNLYIGVGETGAFFTLRETALYPIPGPGPSGNAVINGVYQGTYGLTSFHIQNLSQDPEEAFQKAREYSERVGLPLQNTGTEGLRDEMRKIHRATAEEMEARRKREEENRARWESDRQAREVAKRDLASNGIFPFGPYINLKFQDSPRGYLSWFMDKRDEFEEGSLISHVADCIIRICPELALPKGDPDKFLGEEKQRIELEVFILRVIPRYSDWGTSYLTVMVDTETNANVCSSGAFCPEEETTLKIRGTVKNHDRWNGKAQTWIQRVKVL